LQAFSNSDHPPWEEALTSTNSKITHKILTNDKALSLIGCMKSLNNGGSKSSRLGIYSSQVPSPPGGYVPTGYPITSTSGLTQRLPDTSWQVLLVMAQFTSKSYKFC